MPADMSRNMVVFELDRNGTLDRVIGQGPTTAPDSVRVAWGEVQAKHHAKEQEVRRIYSEWELSADDEQFVADHFPDAEITYSFTRPADGNWAMALDDARRQTEQAMARQATDEAQAMRGRAPLPVLRDLDGLSSAIEHVSLTPELGLFLAYVGTTERGATGIEYVTHTMIKERRLQVTTLWDEARSSLIHGLQVRGIQEEGQHFVALDRAGGFAASAVGLPDFVEQARTWVGDQRLIVGLPNLDTLLVCAATSPMAHRIEQIVLQSDYQGAVNLTPCVLLYDGRLSLHARRK